MGSFWITGSDAKESGITFSTADTFLTTRTIKRSLNKGFHQGSGTEKDPFLILAEEELFKLGMAEGKLFVPPPILQSNDIRLTGEWTPIITFSGNFDGAGHTISGLKMDAEDLNNRVLSGGEDNSFSIGLLGIIQCMWFIW